MPTSPTFEQVDTLAAQLSLREQAKLLTRIGERLSTAAFAERTKQGVDLEPLRLADQMLAECDGIDDDAQGSHDSVEVLRRLRDERITRLCQNDVPTPASP